MSASGTQAPGSGAEHRRIYLARALRLGIGLASAGAVVAALAAERALLHFDDRVAGVLVGLGIAGIALALVARTMDAECALCGTPRERVARLITGRSVAICDDCVSQATAALAGARSEGRQAWVYECLARLPARCPLKVSRPLLEALVDQDRTAATTRAAVAWAFRLSNHAVARELLESLPEGERQPADWVNLGIALGEEGRYSDAVKATERAGASGAGALRPLVLNNCAWFKLRARPDASASERAEWLREVRDAQRLLVDEATLDARTAFTRGTEAELLHLLGDPDGALRALELVDRHAPHDRQRLVVRARVLASAQRLPEARRALEQALETLHPESLEAREARDLLAGIGRG